jgi:hypothetical protein
MKFFRVLALAMHFPKHANMGQQKKEFAKTSRLFTHICKKCITWHQKSREGKQEWNIFLWIIEFA